MSGPPFAITKTDIMNNSENAPLVKSYYTENK